jgi:hypothetical protein
MIHEARVDFEWRISERTKPNPQITQLVFLGSTRAVVLPFGCPVMKPICLGL